MTKEKEARNNIDEEVVIPVIEEELQVGKRVVEKGGVRITSEVRERPVEETVHLREEEVEVERRPVNRAVTDADVKAFEEGVVEVTSKTEKPVVAKQARVVEEIVVGKEVTEREETVRDSVRRTEVEVERLGGDNEASGYVRDNEGYAQDNRDTGEIPDDLTRLENLDDYEIADDEPDPRGWEVKGLNGETIGTIEYLLASAATMKAYFAVVDCGGWFENKRFAIPLAKVRFDRDEEEANVPFVREQFKRAPEYNERGGDYGTYSGYWNGIGIQERN